MSQSLVDGTALVANLTTFGRALRDLGVPVTTARIADAARALDWVDLSRRDEVRCALRAILVHRQQDLALFDALFERLWTGDPVAPRSRQKRPRAPRDRTKPTPLILASHLNAGTFEEADEQDVLDRTGAYSLEERLRRKRFAEMTNEDLEAARRLMERLRTPILHRRTRRRVSDPSGPLVDPRRVLRETGRLGAVPARLPRRRRKIKPRPVVFIGDVSGSMEKHSRVLLHFFHVAVGTMTRIEAFVFGTRLYHITPLLRVRNPDLALDAAAASVVDFGGGTRIGHSLAEFNRTWGKRVLHRGSIVVIVSDGCDRGDPDVLAREMATLKRRAHRVFWLNPYLGSDRYEPKVAGMSAALPFVDEFLPIHDLRALEHFSDALAHSRKP